MNKVRPSSKNKRKPLAESETEAVPLDLLCEMAWRLSKDSLSQGFKRWDGTVDHRLELEEALGGVWIQSLERADEMIREAIRVRQTERQKYFDTAKFQQWITAKVMPLLTAEEKQTDKVSYVRGCQLITGLKKKADAMERFELLVEKNIQGFLWDSPSKFREQGFSVDDVARRVFKHQTLPKEIVRKPYEYTGRFVGKSRLRKKNSKSFKK